MLIYKKYFFLSNNGFLNIFREIVYLFIFFFINDSEIGRMV